MKQELMQEQKPKIEKALSIPRINLETATFKIFGSSPLLMDKMPEETLKEIEEKQIGKNQVKKKLRNIDKEIELAIHRIPDGRVGYPARGFISGMIESTSFIGDKSFSKKLLRGIQIINAINGLIPIEYKSQTICVHNIKSNTKHTPQFNDWTCELTIKYDKNNVSTEDLATLINYAGFYYGIGIWSPRCKSGGSYGMYKLAEKS